MIEVQSGPRSVGRFELIIDINAISNLSVYADVSKSKLTLKEGKRKKKYVHRSVEIRFIIHR